MKPYIWPISILALALLSPLASAQNQPDLRQLARDAGIIFSGTVQTVEHLVAAPADVGRVRITFRVSDALRGATPGTTLTITEWDGLWMAGDRYRVGESLLLFLYPPSGDLGLTTTVGGEQGRIRAADSQLSIASVARQIGEEPVATPAPSRPRPARRTKLLVPPRMRVQE